MRGASEQKEAILRGACPGPRAGRYARGVPGAYTKTELEGVGRLLGLKGLSKLRKAELARAVAESVPSSSDLLRDMLAACSPGASGRPRSWRAREPCRSAPKM